MRSRTRPRSAGSTSREALELAGRRAGSGRAAAAGLSRLEGRQQGGVDVAQRLHLGAVEQAEQLVEPGGEVVEGDAGGAGVSGGWIGGDVAGGRAGGSGTVKRSFQKPASEEAQPDVGQGRCPAGCRCTSR